MVEFLLTTGDKDATIDAIQELLNASLTSIYIILVTGLQNVPDKDKEAIAQLIKLVGRDHVLDVAQESTSDNKIARNITSVTCTVVDKCKYDWKQQKPCHWDHSDSCQEVLIQVKFSASIFLDYFYVFFVIVCDLFIFLVLLTLMRYLFIRIFSGTCD